MNIIITLYHYYDQQHLYHLYLHEKVQDLCLDFSLGYVREKIQKLGLFITDILEINKLEDKEIIITIFYIKKEHLPMSLQTFS